MLMLYEGPEGAGKTDNAMRMVKHLQAAGVKAKYLREPGGDVVGEAVRAVLLNKEFKGLMEPMAEFFLFQGSRAQFVRRTVRPLLDEGMTVVLDRYSLSTMAYQIAARGLPLAPCLTAIDIATGGLIPDITFLLMCSYETGRERQARAGKAPDRLEAEDPSFHRKVIKGYRDFASILPDWNIKIIETDPLSLDRVFARTLEIMGAEHKVIG